MMCRSNQTFRRIEKERRTAAAAAAAAVDHEKSFRILSVHCCAPIDDAGSAIFDRHNPLLINKAGDS